MYSQSVSGAFCFKDWSSGTPPLSSRQVCSEVSQSSPQCTRTLFLGRSNASLLLLFHLL